MASTEAPEIAPSARSQVAGEVRAHLARRRIPVSRVAEVTGRGSYSYWQRRIVSADVALDVDDLEVLARSLGVDVTEFFGVPGPRAPRPPSGGARGRQLTGPYAGQLVLLPDAEDLHQEFIAHPDAA